MYFDLKPKNNLRDLYYFDEQPFNQLHEFAQGEKERAGTKALLVNGEARVRKLKGYSLRKLMAFIHENRTAFR